MPYIHQEGIQRMEFPDEATYLRCRTEWLERYSHIYIFAYFVSIGAYSDSDGIVVNISPTIEEIRARNEAMSATQRIQAVMSEAQRIAASASRRTLAEELGLDYDTELERMIEEQYGLDEEPSGGRTMTEVLLEEQVAYPVGALVTDGNGNVLYVSEPGGMPIGLAAGGTGEVEEEKEVEVKKKLNIKKKSYFDVIDMD